MIPPRLFPRFVIVVLSLAGMAPAQAQPADTYAITVVPVGPLNTRNSEDAIIALRDGRLLLGWTDFYGPAGHDESPARLSGKISSDGGRTWGPKYTLVENDGGRNVMEVNFLRLKNGNLALFHGKKNTKSTDSRIEMRVSADEGRTFGPAKELSPAGKYTGLTNGRSIRLASGRILLEVWVDGDSYCLLSDDEGEHWHEGHHVRPAKGDCYEPACIQLKDGSVMILLRTSLGGQYKSLSHDGGETWSEPVPTALTGTDAPVAITRVPSTGDLLAIWDHNPGLQRKKRTPLTAAISSDEGVTWTHFHNLEEKPGDAWAYPAVTWVGDRALVTYFNYTGGNSLQLRSLPSAWFYR